MILKLKVHSLLNQWYNLLFPIPFLFFITFFGSSLYISNLSADPQYQNSELLNAIASGDEQAFASFIHRHTDSIYSYILKITKSESWAEEIVQDVWMQVWEGREKFAQIENPVAYLHRMAQNRSIDWIRKNRRELELQYHLQKALAATADPVTEKIYAAELYKLLLKGINDLPPQRRKILQLKQAGLSYEQIARELQISKNTVRNQMVSALSALRELIRGYADLGFLLFYIFFRGE